MRDFSTSFVIPYDRTISSYPSHRCGGSRTAPVVIDWQKFGLDIGTARRVLVNTGVRINLSQPPQAVLEKAQSVFIDNANVSSPVFLRCVDTNYTVVCADQTQGWFNLETGGTEFVLYVQDAAKPYDLAEKTSLHFSDAPAPAYTTDEKTSSFLTQTQISGDRSFATEVYGDQFASVNCNAAGSSANSVSSPTVTIIPAVANTTIVLTQIRAAAMVDLSSQGRYAYFSIAHGTRTILQGTIWMRPYNEPRHGFRAPIVEVSGNVAARFNGASALTCRFTLQSISGGTNQFNYDLQVGVTVCFARLDNQTV